MIVSNTKTPSGLSPTNLHELARFCVSLTELGKQVIHDFSGDRLVREKSPRDFVTAVDEAVQRHIWKRILEQFPASRLLGEESGSEADSQKLVGTSELIFSDLFLDVKESVSNTPLSVNSPITWIIDPIDGTANFVRDIPYYAVSVAAVLENRVVAGAVLDVCHNRCYWAAANGTAMMNNAEIKTSSCNDFSYAMLAISLPCDPASRESAFRKAQHISEQCANIRRLGSAALNICNVASGSLDGYWAGMLNLWDVAAAGLILKKAGGFHKLQSIPGDWKLSYLCSNNQDLGGKLENCISS